MARNNINDENAGGVQAANARKGVLNKREF